jgi:hypothetical protein
MASTTEDWPKQTLNAREPGLLRVQKGVPGEQVKHIESLYFVFMHNRRMLPYNSRLRFWAAEGRTGLFSTAS